MLENERTVTWQQVLERFGKQEYTLLDVRQEEAYAYGSIPGAVHIPDTQLEEQMAEIDSAKPVVVYCKKGEASVEAAGKLYAAGYDAYNLAGGYNSWLVANLNQDTKSQEDIEKSIRKKFHKSLFSRFAKAINEYQLVKENDRIAVCISGGKGFHADGEAVSGIKKAQ